MTTTAKIATLGATLTSNWIGVAESNGKLYNMPWDATDILIVDIATQAATRSNMGASLTGTRKYSSAVVGADGKIYGIPRDATTILIIDPVAGTATESNMGADLSGADKWHNGFVSTYDNKIYCCPVSATDILIIDTSLGTATRSAMGATLPGSYGFVGCVLGNDGKIYGIPYNATDILIIDPSAGTATLSAMGATLTGTQKWAGGAVGPDGKIYAAPRDATDILIIDTTAGTASRSSMGATLTGTYKWVGFSLGSDNRLYAAAKDANDILVIDTNAGTATRETFGIAFSGADKWLSNITASDGKIYSTPRDAGLFLIIDPSGSGVVWDATSQAYNPAWAASSAVECYRQQILASSIIRGSNRIKLGFQGRADLSYTIKKVSIAEKDTAEGSIVDSTWTKVTFDGNFVATWGTDSATVPVDDIKWSDQIDFALDESKDYYVTFMMGSAGTVLTTPAGYSELYFATDHADDLDWAGYSTRAQRIHALTEIWATEGGGFHSNMVMALELIL